MKKIKKIDVSVVMPLFNGEAFVENSIRSVITQSFQNWELIIVDDASTDRSVNIVKSLVGEDHRIKLIKLPRNSGAAVARNLSIKYAQGRYIAFLDSDDLWLAQKLSKQLAFMKNNSCPFAFSSYDKIDEGGSRIGYVGAPEKVDYADLLKMCSIGCLTAIYDTNYFGKVYMPDIRKRQDLGLWLALLKRTTYAYGISESLAQYRVRPESLSSNKIAAAQFQWKLYRQIENLSFTDSSYYFFEYGMRGLLRSKAPALARLLGVLK